MADTVKVSMIQPQSLRFSKDGETFHYPRGIVEMPLDHAKALGVTHRIVQVTTAADGSETVVAGPFDGAFDAKLSGQLVAAGYTSLAALRTATQDELLAIPGIGPANYERIQHALKGI